MDKLNFTKLLTRLIQWLSVAIPVANLQIFGVRGQVRAYRLGGKCAVYAEFRLEWRVVELGCVAPVAGAWAVLAVR